MLSSALRFAFDKLLPGVAASRYQLGSEIDKKVGCVRGTYDYAKQGGVTGGVYSLKDKYGYDLKLPKNAIVTSVFVHVLTPVTSAGAATVALQANAGGDLLAATAKTSFTQDAMVQGIPDAGTAADNVLLTADRVLKLAVGTADLTAGKLNVFCEYVLSGTD